MAGKIKMGLRVGKAPWSEVIPAHLWTRSSHLVQSRLFNEFLLYRSELASMAGRFSGKFAGWLLLASASSHLSVVHNRRRVAVTQCRRRGELKVIINKTRS